MRKSWLLLLTLGILFLTGCTNKITDSQIDETNNEINVAKKFVEQIATKIKKTKKDVKEQVVSSRFFDKDLSGYMVANNAVPPQGPIQKALDQTFDGRVAFNHGDGIWDSFVNYLNDKLICGVYEKINHDLNGVLERLYGEDVAEQDAADKEMERIFQESSSTLEISCAEFTGDAVSPLEFTFNVAGEEPFWNWEIRVDSLNYTLPNTENNDFISDSAYISSFKKVGENRTFNGNIHTLWAFTGELTKVECIDGGERRSPWL